MKNIIRVLIGICAFSLMALAGCVKNDPEPAIPNAIPAGSKFSKIAVGWTMKEVHAVIGKPTDSHGYETGTKILSVSFGAEYLVEDLYKGNGRIIYESQDGKSSQDFPVRRIIYDPNESGRLDKAAYPDGPQNRKMPPPAPGKPARSSKSGGQGAKAGPAKTAPAADGGQSAPAPKAPADDPLGGL